MVRHIAILVLLGAFAPPAPAAEPDEARSLAGRLVQRLGAALKQEMASGGPEQAITVCRDLAPSLAGELSRQSGARVARVSLKTRNPLLGLPDAWEQAALLEFERRLAAGEKVETLEHFEIVDEPQGKALRYVKALPVQPLCLACHGGTEAMAEPVRAKLAAEYPHDRATGYAVGQIRGAVTVRQRLEPAP
jgi:hypothetical protein